MKFICLYAGIYKVSVIIHIGGDFKNLESNLKKNKYPQNIIDEIKNHINTTTHQSYGGMCYWNPEIRTALILIKEPIEDIYGLSYLAHELYHAVSFVLESVGMKSTIETEEAYAYFYEYLFLNVMSNFESNV